MLRIFLAFLVLSIAVPAGAALTRIGTGTRVTCGTTATKADDTSVPDTMDRTVTICVPSDAAGSVHVGNQSTTTSSGITVDPGKCYSPGGYVAKNVAVWCVAASATVVEVQEAS